MPDGGGSEAGGLGFVLEARVEHVKGTVGVLQAIKQTKKQASLILCFLLGPVLTLLKQTKKQARLILCFLLGPVLISVVSQMRKI